MRKTNLNQAITRIDVKEGDKIRITREVTVKSVRAATLTRHVGDAIIVTTRTPDGNAGDTLSLTHKEALTLLERDERSVVIPDDALFVYWQDDDDEDYYARRDGDKWIENDGDSYDSTEKLIEYIHRYGEINTFQVLKSKPKPATGGVVHGVPIVRDSGAGRLAAAMSAPTRPAFNSFHGF